MSDLDSLIRRADAPAIALAAPEGASIAVSERGNVYFIIRQPGDYAVWTSMSPRQALRNAMRLDGCTLRGFWRARRWSAGR